MATMSKRGRGKGSTQTTTPWWAQSSTDIGAAVIASANKCHQNQLGVEMRNYRSALLYGGQGYLSTGRFSPSIISAGAVGVGPGGISAGAYASPRYNLIYSMVSTVTSRLIAPGMPAVSILSNEGDWELRHKAGLLDQYVEGLMYQTHGQEQAFKALKDATVFGTGFVKVYADSQLNIKVERTFPGALWCEMWDGRDGNPRTLYQTDYVDRDVLLARFPNRQNEIRAALPLSESSYATESVGTRVIPFYEAWHLPSAIGAKDGRHVLCIAGSVLLNEPWLSDKFPFAVIRFDDSLAGYYGRGLAELLYPHQAALSTVQRAEYHAWSQVALPRLWVDINSKINEDHLSSSRSGSIIRGIGQAPQVLNWTGTHPDFVAYKQWIISSAYEFVGVSQMSASGSKPAGLNSGAAQREFMDIQADRFASLSEKWQQFFVDIADALIRVSREVYAIDKNFAVPVIGKSFVKEIPWKAVDMADDCFQLKVYPISSLPHTPAGRLSAVQEMMQANLITREEGLRLLKFPDLDDVLSLENAQEDNAELTAYTLLQLGVYKVPDPLQNLPLCIQTVQKEAIKAIDGGAPQERIDLCRRWLVQAKALVQPPAPQLPAPGGAPGAGAPPPNVGGGPPLAQGAPLPVSTQLPYRPPR
jgi:hypothetical protein